MQLTGAVEVGEVVDLSVFERDSRSTASEWHLQNSFLCSSLSIFIGELYSL